MSLASVELRAVADCALDWCGMAPPQCVIACPVVNLLLVELIPHATSTKHTGFASSVSVGCLGDSCDDFGISGVGSSGRSVDCPILWNVIPFCC